MTEGGTCCCHLTLSDSDPSGCFGTTKPNRMSDFGDDLYTGDVAYEEADVFEVSDWKGM